MLRGENLKKSFAKQSELVLDGVNIELEAGQISVIIGPSGSGKTTLLKVLAMLDLPQGGSIHVDDWHVRFPLQKGQKIEPPWPKVTVVFQQLFLWPHLTLRQNVTLPLSLHHGRENMLATKAADEEKVEELVALFEMSNFIDRFPNQASLGQRQRVALARALLLRPKYLLLDEITSSLDVEQVAIILTYLKKLAASGIGILTVTHLLHFAREAADSVIFMESGRVIEKGGKEVLINPVEDRVRRFLSVIEAAT